MDWCMDLAVRGASWYFELCTKMQAPIIPLSSSGVVFVSLLLGFVSVVLLG